MDISDLHKADVLSELFNRAKRKYSTFEGFQEMNALEAQLELDNNPSGVFKELYGRALYVNLSNMQDVSFFGYDLENGTGLSRAIIKKLRSNNGNPKGA